MTVCKTVITPLLTHWSYHSLALSHRLYDFYKTDIKVRLIKSIFHQSVSSGCQNKALYDFLQNCGNSSANTLELPQYCTKPSAILFLMADILVWLMKSIFPQSVSSGCHNKALTTQCKTVVNPVLVNWSYHSIALSHRLYEWQILKCGWSSPSFPNLSALAVRTRRACLAWSTGPIYWAQPEPKYTRYREVSVINGKHLITVNLT